MKPLDYVEKKAINQLGWNVKTENRARERSMIHPQYAERFIEQYILDVEGNIFF